jgi:hypothetical protein
MRDKETAIGEGTLAFVASANGKEAHSSVSLGAPWP